jgi:maltooligosyltrehalose trehalohydrolase
MTQNRAVRPGDVWAPAARTVAVHLPAADDAGTRTLDLTPAGDGWWTVGEDLPHGTDYAFVLDGGDPRPDPRSPWQPDGVHGASRVFDASRHAWADAGWAGRDARGAVVYELHVGTFTPEGTLDAAAARLGHLVELGVEVVELLPLAPFNGVHGWGYDGVSLYGVHEPYGGPGALQRFVDAAHVAGLAVCLDVVHNHLGPSGNYLGEFGPYFTDAHHTPWGAAINLDGEGAEHVRRWILDSALRWFRDFHVDALRLDAVHALVDESPRHVLAQLSDEVAALAAEVGRPLSLIAEVDLNDPVSVTPTAEGGWGMTAQWADDVHHALHALLTGERHGYYVDFGAPETLRKAMRDVFVHDGTHSTFRGEDWGAPVPPEVDGHRFVVFGSDHDQVGNRALGDRPSASLDDGALAASAALVLLSPYTPMLFMGEEWAAGTPWMYVTDHPEPELAQAVREGRSREFGGHGWAEMYGADEADFEVPDPQDPATFEAGRLDWSEPAQPRHARVLEWYRTLVALRVAEPALSSGDRTTTDLTWAPVDVPADGAWADWLVLHRGHARVVVNLADAERTVPLGTDRACLTVRAAWTEARVLPPEDGGDTHVVLGPRSVAVLA